MNYRVPVMFTFDVQTVWLHRVPIWEAGNTVWSGGPHRRSMKGAKAVCKKDCKTVQISEGHTACQCEPAANSTRSGRTALLRARLLGVLC
jgi:hypothetical protein